MSETHTLALDDFLEERRALEDATQTTGEIHQQDSQQVRSAISDCRKLAVGILAITHSLMEDLLEDGPFDSKLAYCLACTVAFAQGANISNSLITQAQYMKAAAVLKQDIELLARFREAVEDRAAKGKTPQMSSAPEWARRAYGELNKIAHPSNFEEMHSVLSFPDGNFSILPLRQPETESALFRVHVWSCIEISRATIELLALLIETRPANPEAGAVLEASLAVLGQILEKADRGLWLGNSERRLYPPLLCASTKANPLG